MESQLAQLLSEWEGTSQLLSGEEAARCADLAQQLEAKLRQRQRATGEANAIHFYLPNKTEQCFTVHQSRTVIHLLLGNKLGSRAFLFGARPHHVTLLNGLFCGIIAIFCTALLQETSSSIVWAGFAMQLYITVWMSVLFQVDIAKRLLLNFEVWYLGLQLVSCFGVFIPMSFDWDARAAISILLCFGTIFGLMADAFPPLGSEAIRVGWMFLVPFTAVLAGGYKFKWFVDLHLREVSLGRFSWDLEELIVGRLLVLILFGCRYVFKFFVNPCDTMYFKTSMSRSDIQERFILLRELGLLSPGQHVPLSQRMQPTPNQGPKMCQLQENDVATLNASSNQTFADLSCHEGGVFRA